MDRVLAKRKWLTKSKAIVILVLVALTAIMVLILVDDHVARARREAARITIRFGFLVAGIESDCATLIDFNVAMGSEIAARLGMRVAFITGAQDEIFAALEAGRHDIVIPAIPVTPELQAAYNFSKPYKALPRYDLEPDLFAIAFKKGNDRLTVAVNGALEEMFNDRTMLRISMETFGVDMVTEAWQRWR